MKDLIYPDREHVTEARHSAGHTQDQAAASIYICPRTWQRYEAGQCGMPAAYWELYLLKTGQLKRPRA